MSASALLSRRMGTPPYWPDITGRGWLWGYGLAAVAALLASGLIRVTEIDQPLFYTLNQAGTALPSALWQWVTFLGDTHTAVVIAFVFSLRWPQLMWATVYAALVGTVLTHVPKELLDVPRPPGALDVDTFHIVGKAYEGESFPSGHTLTAFTLVGAIAPFLHNPWFRAILFSGAALVGLSRVMVGIHWPADVFAGAAGGLVAAWIGLAAARRWPWGLRPRVNVGLAAVFTAAALALFWHDGHYPAAIWLARPLSVLALIAAGTCYWWPVLRPDDETG